NRAEWAPNQRRSAYGAVGRNRRVVTATRWSQCVAQSACHLAQQRIARVVPERVVDALELVEVDIQKSHAAVMRTRVCERLRQVFADPFTVRQTRQRIAVGKPVYVRFRFLALRD